MRFQVKIFYILVKNYYLSHNCLIFRVILLQNVQRLDFARLLVYNVNMNKKREPIYRPIGSMPAKATWKLSCPFDSLDAAFNWNNVEYPVEHTHAHWEILLVTSGRILHTINGKEKVLTKGDVWLVRPEDKHKLTYADKDHKDYQSITFVFTDELFAKLSSAYGHGYDVRKSDANLSFTIDGELVDYAIECCLTAQMQPKDKYQTISTIVINRLFLVLLEKRMNNISSYPDWLNDFISYLNSPYRFAMSVRELARQTPYSYSRLTTLFKFYTGQTLLQYINELKLVFAKKLLRTTDKQILEISNDIYYDSVSSFNHNFKKKFGKTPSEYRKAHAAPATTRAEQI